ncbi:Lysine-ketoglutarate reductase/saccharopine dehydrogenase [Oopsacas minuta]|uniref:Lysine-ketoglutarate reductase/saccharopine dehydrogenase n=1 Tax=Oopsacas minuta TaxID=111878 RepID=A0AAV7KKV6_9METZ|nr:Lysine-ketoglutarate reductase/saccharopine dehydrogenase [Oopsacas minuta]
MLLTKTFQRFSSLANSPYPRLHPHFVPTLQTTESTTTKVPLPLTSPKNVIVLGAGLVSRPLIKYFARDPMLNIKILTKDLGNDTHFYDNNVQLYDVDCMDKDVMTDFLDQCDLVISLLPRKMHFNVANMCLESRRCLVTPSYASPELLSLDKEARDRGILILNELGLAPGIDHMLSKRIFDEVENNGGKVTAYNSWTGGLPTPKSVDNSMGYKFTWDPEGVLMNIWNPIKFIENSHLFNSDGGEIIKFLRPINILDGLELEGYPNRDSAKYIELYKIPHAKTVLRGTLRFSGYYRALEAFRKIGLLTREPLDWEVTDGMTFREFIDITIRQNYPSLPSHYSTEQLLLKVLDNDEKSFADLKSLGLLSDTLIEPGRNPVQILASFMTKWYHLKPGDRDWAVTIQRVEIEWGEGSKSRMVAMYSLLGGDVSMGEDTAMAVSVGLPIAIAAKLILRREINETGVHYPLKANMYKPILKELEEEGLEFSNISYPLF